MSEPVTVHGARKDFDLGDLVVVLLAGSLAGLRDRLEQDGFEAPAQLVGDLTEIADMYISGIAH